MSDRWAFCKIYDIADVDDPTQIYLRRYRIIQTPWCALYLHKINLDDGDRCIHDHPYNFFSLVLRGGYEEIVDKCPYPDGAECEDEIRTWGAGSLHWMKAEWFHRITALNRTPTWTLLFVGRRRRKWGFRTQDGWVPWDEYLRSAGTATTGKSFA